jgi:hypothetical protein
MQGIFASVAKLLGRKSISHEEVLEVLRNHEQRIAGLEKGLDDMAQKVEDRLKELSKKSQAAKKQATKDLEQLRRELDSLVGALEIVIAGELAPARRNEIKNLMKMARGRRTRINNIIEARVH